MFRTAYREIGLFGLVKRTVNEFLEDDMPTYASALAYQMLFSLFPFLLVLITLVGYLHRSSSPGCASRRRCCCRPRRWIRSTR